MSSIIGGLLAFTSAILKSGSELISKSVLNNKLNPYVVAFGYSAFSVPVLFLLLLFDGIPEVESSFWIALLSSGILNIIASITYMKALKEADISIVSPIKSITPMFLLITSPIMVDQYASFIGVIGVVFVTFGLYMLQLTGDQDSILEPIRKLRSNKGARLAFLVAILYSITSNIDVVGIEASSAIFWAFSLFLFMGVSIFIIILYETENGVEKIKLNWKKLLAMGSLSGLAVAAQMVALTYTLVVYVIAIKRTALLWNILGGIIFLNEKGLKNRIIGGILILIGVIIISTAL